MGGSSKRAAPDSAARDRVAPAAWKGLFLLPALLGVGVFVGFSLCAPRRP